MDSPALSPRDRRAFWLLMLLALVVLAAGIGQRDPWPSDEPRFALSAKQMVDSGDWLFPHRGHELYSDKPPMLMWLEAGSYEVVRDWRIAFLLPSLLAGLLCIGLTWDIGRRLWNPRVGIYAGGALLFAFQFVFQVKRAQIDPLVMGWITLANWGLLLHCLRGPDWRAYWLGCFAAGLGVITKGVGFLALLMLLPYAYARWRGWDGVARTSHSALRWLGGALAFLLPILAWGLPMLLVAHARATPQYAGYVHDLLFRQTAERYADAWGHQQPLWYYLPNIAFNWFPLSLPYFGLLVASLAAWRGKSAAAADAAGPLTRWRLDLKARDPRLLLPLLWVLIVIVFFSLSRGKREVYLMPVLPMTALGCAPYLEAMIRARWMRWTAFAVALVGGIAIVAVGAWALSGHSAAAQDLVQRRGLDTGGAALWYFVLAVGAALLASALIFRPRRGVHASLVGLTALWLLWGFWACPVLNDSSSSAGVMRRADAIVGRGEMGMVAWKEQNLLMAGRPVTEFGFLRAWDAQYADAIRWQAQSPATRWVFILDNAMGDCIDRKRAVEVGNANRRAWWLFRSDAVVPGCVPKIDAGHEESERAGE